MFWPVALSVLEMSPQVLGPLATVRAGPDILLGVDPADVAVECALAGGGVAAVRAGQGLVTQGAGLHVRGEILVEFPTVGTHPLVSLHEGTGPCLLAGLWLRLLGSVLVCVVVPDVTTQGVVSLELLPTELADVRKVLVEPLELPARVPFLAEATAEVLLLRPLLAPQLLTGLVGVKVPEVTGEGIVGFEFLLADHTDVLEMLEIFLEILVVPLATPAVGLAVELEFVFLKQLELRETDLRNDNISVLNILSSPTLSFSLSLSPYKYHRC